MKKMVLTSLLAAQASMSPAAMGAPATLSVMVSGIENGQPIPEKFAYCVPDGNGRTKNGGNVNPAISWSGTPTGTQSYALIVVDPDVPASFDSANKPDKTIPENFPRRDFFHWVLADIPAGTTRIDEGVDSRDVTKGGKPAGKTAYGLSGMNSYPGGGYDGPCPPWNDERLHHYHFTVYALDVPSLGLTPPFDGRQLRDAMARHVLAQGEVVGTYTNNPKRLK